MNRSRYLICLATLIALSGPAVAQERNGNFLDNLFNRGDTTQQSEDRQGQRVAQADPGDISVRLDRLENALRQLTGTIEQLQYRNQQLEAQVKRMQESGVSAPVAPPPRVNQQPGNPGSVPPPANTGRRGDVFDPAQQPNAPGAPRTLGNQTLIAAPEPTGNEPPVGAPGGRDAGAPLDLNTLAGNASASEPPSQAGSDLPPPRNVSGNANAGGTQLATLPPTASPKDEYDMAYGYVLHKDYALAEQSFREFLRKYPTERLVPDAQYWLGESLFQRQRYRDAAESFLAVSTKYEKSGKAPDSLLRLGQSLAALNQKEAACATLAEVDRKFPKASATVKRGVEQEQKRVHC